METGPLSRHLSLTFNAAWVVLCALLLQWSGAEFRPLSASAPDAVAGTQVAYERGLAERVAPNKATRVAAKEPRHAAAIHASDPPILATALAAAVFGGAASVVPCGTPCAVAAAPSSHRPRAPPVLS